MCLVTVSFPNKVAFVCMILLPFLFLLLVRNCQSIRKLADWASCCKLAETLYMAFFLVVILEANRLDHVLCYDEGRAISCATLSCEILHIVGDESNRDCNICKPHWDLVRYISPTMLIAPITALTTALTHNKDPSEDLFRLFKWIHGINVVVWYALGFTIKFYRCQCKWYSTVDLTIGFFGPLSAVLLILTYAAEQNGSTEAEEEAEEEAVSPVSKAETKDRDSDTNGEAADPGETQSTESA